MKHAKTNIVAALCLLTATAVAEQAAETLACTDEPTILSIEPFAGFAEIDESDALPGYEVKYRHCDQIHRLLIQQPKGEAENVRPALQPIFF